MADLLKFELVSPERLLSSGDVQQVVVPGTEGEFTVLVNHAPVLSTLKPGVVTVTDENGKYSIRIPVPLERCLITVNGRRYNGKYVRVESKNFGRELDPNDRNVQGGKITGNVSVDFSFAE